MYLKITLLVVLAFPSAAQTSIPTGAITGNVVSDGLPLYLANITLVESKAGAATDSTGYFHINNLKPGTYTLKASATGYTVFTRKVSVTAGGKINVQIRLQADVTKLNDIVVTGTLKPVSRAESPVPVEVYTSKYFQKNPSPSLFESIGMVNGVRPQLNCNVCNTGDIHINGMEGAYTLILIDGMPIVSALSTVYGLSGIPMSMVERIEVVKGPGSSLYGSEAMGGIVNVITKNPMKAPLISADVYSTSWGEYNVDAALKVKAGSAQGLVGVSYFNYQQPKDNNKDGFTDLTLQNRISIFNKWAFHRKEDRQASIAARYVYENRWGGICAGINHGVAVIVSTAKVSIRGEWS
ncbi:TonB-dependent receptor [Chitinophaga pinensis]|uniref:TonB-dependent receptor n=1 Tax=Chitinophaga pinensis TaxID=79329 RepID=UPI0028F702DB|nr:TonB-dependent receptor plug domain-containing protein [Chitinophaga pinensis]